MEEKTVEKKTFKNIYEKLLYIQENLKAPKNQYNDFGNYMYRSCEDIQEAVKPLLAEVGCVLILTDDVQQIGDSYYVIAKATLIDCDTAVEISNRAYAKEDSAVKGVRSSQITGATSSYARKYALNGMFCISDEKDPDTNEDRKEINERRKKAQEEEKKMKRALTEDEILDMRKMFRENGIDEAKVLVMCRVETMEKMTYKLYKNVMDHRQSVKESCSI